MKNIRSYDSKINENSQEKINILTNNRGQKIEIHIQGGRITEIKNVAHVRFPFNIGSLWNRSIETWACNNGFPKIEIMMNGRIVKNYNTCPEEKIMGIKKKDVPPGHVLRQIYPGKFR